MHSKVVVGTNDRMHIVMSHPQLFSNNIDKALAYEKSAATRGNAVVVLVFTMLSLSFKHSSRPHA